MTIKDIIRIVIDVSNKEPKNRIILSNGRNTYNNKYRNAGKEELTLATKHWRYINIALPNEKVETLPNKRELLLLPYTCTKPNIKNDMHPEYCHDQFYIFDKFCMVQYESIHGNVSQKNTTYFLLIQFQ